MTSIHILRLLAPLLAALSISASASAHETHWNTAGASIYGDTCGSGSIGYRGDYLPDHPWSFAELDMGTALGNLPNHTRIRILYPRTHRKKTIMKRDIGGGGGPIEGVPRKIDLYAPAAEYLNGGQGCNWTGVVLWRRL